MPSQFKPKGHSARKFTGASLVIQSTRNPCIQDEGMSQYLVVADFLNVERTQLRQSSST